MVGLDDLKGFFQPRRVYARLITSMTSMEKFFFFFKKTTAYLKKKEKVVLAISTRPTLEPPKNSKTLPNTAAKVMAANCRAPSAMPRAWGCVCVSQSQCARGTRGQETRGRSVHWVS